MDNSLSTIKELQTELFRNEESIKFKSWLSLGFVAALIIDLLFISVENKAVHAVFFLLIISGILGSLITNVYRNKDIRYKLDRLCFERYKKHHEESHIDIINDKGIKELGGKVEDENNNTLYFKDNISAFEYICEFGNNEIIVRHALAAIVERADNIKRTDNNFPTLAIRVSSLSGVFIH